jgi:fatty acid synthase, animal type
MGVRASMDATQREKDGTLKDEIWPSQRTVLIRADKGVASQPHAVGASRLFDLECWTSNVEMYELHGTHFGILSPNSGLVEIINKVLEEGGAGII